MHRKYLMGEIYTGKQKGDQATIYFKKYRLLTRGAFKPNLSSPSIAERDTLYEKGPFIDYAMKFRNWYGSELYTDCKKK